MGHYKGYVSYRSTIFLSLFFFPSLSLDQCALLFSFSFPFLFFFEIYVFAVGLNLMPFANLFHLV